MTRDIFPHADADFNNWVVPFNTYAAANPAAVALSPEDITVLVASVTAWTTAYGVTQNPSTATSAKNEARAGHRAVSDAGHRPASAAWAGFPRRRYAAAPGQARRRASLLASRQGRRRGAGELLLMGTPTASPFQIAYDIAQAGQPAYYRARWINSTNQPGRGATSSPSPFPAENRSQPAP